MFKKNKRGMDRFFKSQAFHYQVLRTMGHSLGANPGECLVCRYSNGFTMSNLF